MQTGRVQKQMDNTIECKVENVTDLSVDIAWTPIEINGEEESYDKEQEVKDLPNPPRTLLFLEKMKKLSLH